MSKAGFNWKTQLDCCLSCLHAFPASFEKLSVYGKTVYLLSLFHHTTSAYSEVKRTMIARYEGSMGLAQSQLTNVEVCLS